MHAVITLCIMSCPGPDRPAEQDDQKVSGTPNSWPLYGGANPSLLDTTLALLPTRLRLAGISQVESPTDRQRRVWLMRKCSRSGVHSAFRRCRPAHAAKRAMLKAELRFVPLRRAWCAAQQCQRRTRSERDPSIATDGPAGDSTQGRPCALLKRFLLDGRPRDSHAIASAPLVHPCKLQLLVRINCLRA
jgi:hypothetical protein